MKALILMCLLMPLSVAAQTSNVVRDYDRFEDRTGYWTLPIDGQCHVPLDRFTYFR
jgi:hypothetical protein